MFFFSAECLYLIPCALKVLVVMKNVRLHARPRTSFSVTLMTIELVLYGGFLHTFGLSYHLILYFSPLCRYFSCETGPSVYTVSSVGLAPTSRSGIRTGDARIIRSLRLRSNHCATRAAHLVLRVWLIDFECNNISSILRRGPFWWLFSTAGTYIAWWTYTIYNRKVENSFYTVLLFT
jgi:hypothetical protein